MKFILFMLMLFVSIGFSMEKQNPQSEITLELQEVKAEIDAVLFSTEAIELYSFEVISLAEMPTANSIEVSDILKRPQFSANLVTFRTLEDQYAMLKSLEYIRIIDKFVS